VILTRLCTFATANNRKWQTKRDVERMCVDAWRWQSHNPDGFATEAPTTPAWTPTPL
jgi:hypothetical protein